MRDEGGIQDVKVGVFVLAALAILITGALWIAGSAAFGARRTHYTVVLPDSGGVQVGDRVRIAGVVAGRVRGVRLQPDPGARVRIDVSVREEYPLRTGARASIEAQGLLGAYFLQIDPGPPGNPRLPPGSEIPGRGLADMTATLGRLDDVAVQVAGLLDQTAGILDDLSARVGVVLARVENLLSEENADEVRRILASARHTLDETGPRVPDLLARLEEVLDNAERGSEQMPEIASELSALVADVRGALGPDGARLERLLDEADRGLASATDLIDGLGGGEREFAAAMSDLRDTLANLKQLSQLLEERPYSLVRIRSAPDRKPGEGAGGGR